MLYLGYGGMINDLLSWKFFLPLSRISFMTYLIHAFFIFITNGFFRYNKEINTTHNNIFFYLQSMFLLIISGTKFIDILLQIWLKTFASKEI